MDGEHNLVVVIHKTTDKRVNKYMPMTDKSDKSRILIYEGKILEGPSKTDFAP